MIPASENPSPDISPARRQESMPDQAAGHRRASGDGADLPGLTW
jgi:hypothetical protein